MKTHNELSNFVVFYKILPEKVRPKFLMKLGEILGLAQSTLYQRMQKNAFSAEERALISYHLGIPQSVLFPDKEKILEVSEEYKKKYASLYIDFFRDYDFYVYNPQYFIDLLKSENYLII